MSDHSGVPAEEPDSLDSIERMAQAFAQARRAPATRRAYAGDWKDFAGWCAQYLLDAAPAAPRTVALYLAARSVRLKMSTLQRRLAAIVICHRDLGFTFNPRAGELSDVWKGIRRHYGTAKKGKAPILDDDLVTLLADLPATLMGKRDRAILALTFSAALRRSETVALNLGDLEWTSEGLLVHVARSKGDQEGEGDIRAVPLGQHSTSCPVSAVRDWIMAARLDQGPVFRPITRWGVLGAGRLCGRTVARVVKRAVADSARHEGLSAGAIAARVQTVSGHSLRSGFATSAAAAGAEEWEIMRQTGHQKRESVQGYIRLGRAFNGHVCHRLRL